MRRLAVWLLAFCLLLPPTAWADSDPTQGGKYPQTIESETLVALATEQVESAMADLKETRRHTLEVSKAPRSLHAPAGELTYDVSIPNGLRYGGTTPVYVAIKTDGVPYRQVICYFRLHVYDQIVVAAKDLRPAVVLGASDLRLEEREVGSTSAKYLTSVDAAVGHEVNRLVREGIMLTEPMLQNPVIMQAGVQIYIVANVNGVRIKTEGVTLQRGREGDIIRVRNVHSSKVLRAKVLDATTVEVLQ